MGEEEVLGVVDFELILPQRLQKLFQHAAQEVLLLGGGQCRQVVLLHLLPDDAGHLVVDDFFVLVVAHRGHLPRHGRLLHFPPQLAQTVVLLPHALVERLEPLRTSQGLVPLGHLADDGLQGLLNGEGFLGVGVELGEEMFLEVGEAELVAVGFLHGEQIERIFAFDLDCLEGDQVEVGDPAVALQVELAQTAAGLGAGGDAVVVEEEADVFGEGGVDGDGDGLGGEAEQVHEAVGAVAVRPQEGRGHHEEVGVAVLLVLVGVDLVVVLLADHHLVGEAAHRAQLLQVQHHHLSARQARQVPPPQPLPTNRHFKVYHHLSSSSSSSS